MKRTINIARRLRQYVVGKTTYPVRHLPAKIKVPAGAVRPVDASSVLPRSEAI